MVWRLFTTLFLLLACPLALLAQPRPGAFSTLATTNAGANSLNVGCAIGSNTCTGGIDAGSIVLSSTGAASIDTEGGITAGSGNVGIVDTTGKIPAISSTYFASLSGADLTGILETAIADGAVLARVAGNEIISGLWTFGTASTSGIVALNTPTASNAGVSFAVNGVANGQLVQGTGGTFHDGPGTYEWRTNAGASRATLAADGLYTALGGLATGGNLRMTNIISGGTLVNGSNDNLNPAGLATGATIVLTSAGGSTVLTGIVAQPNGTIIRLCTDGLIGFAHDSTSTDANRLWILSGTTNLTNGCTEAQYDSAADGGVGKWRLTAW